MPRIPLQAKEETRRRILAAARELFGEHGFEGASTRALSRRASIATGTLFNYFPSKEALALALVGEALEKGTAGFLARRHGGEGAEEDLFAHVAAILRELEPTRGYLAEVLETALSPLATSRTSPGADELRARHLETVDALLREHGLAAAATPIALHLYWTLFLGVLAYWTGDPSPVQEDTLVVLDRSMRLLVDSLHDPSRDPEVPNGNATGPAPR